MPGRRMRQVTIIGVKRALNRGVPVLAVDSVTSHQDHVVVVTGYEGVFWIRDALGRSICPGKRSVAVELSLSPYQNNTFRIEF